MFKWEMPDTQSIFAEKDFGRHYIVFYSAENSTQPVSARNVIPFAVAVVDEQKQKLLAKNLHWEQVPHEHIEKDKLDPVSMGLYDIMFSERFPNILNHFFGEYRERVRQYGYRRNDPEYRGVAYEIARAFSPSGNCTARTLAQIPRTATLEEQCSVIFEKKVVGVLKHEFQGWAYNGG